MNQPAPRELCEKLQAMGCVSESGLYWGPNGKFFFSEGDVQIFFQNDFTGATERARENSKIAWPGYYNDNCRTVDELKEKEFATGPDSWSIHRHRMIDICFMPWFEFLERTMRK